MKTGYSKKERFLCVFLAAAVLLMRLYHISELDGPFLWGDEIAYWSHAANLSGLSWTEVINVWYSYGYSMLLVPLFWITHDMLFLYRMAIVLNACMGVCSFLLGTAVIRKIDEQCSHVTGMLVSFAAASYSAYIFQSNIAWSETFLYTWFLLLVWSAVKFFQQPVWKNLLLMTAVTAFLYIIHNRCFVAAAAYLLTLLYMVLKGKIDAKKAAAAVLLLAAAYALNSDMKVIVSERMWGTADAFTGNDMSAHSGKIALLFQLDGLKTLFQSFAGKLWYMLSASLMLAYLGVTYIGKKMISALKKQEDAISEGMFCFYIFFSLVICGTIAVAAVATIPQAVDYSERVRLDLYFYGRYSETLSGMLIIFGLLNLAGTARKKRWAAEYAAGLVLYVSCSASLYWQTKDMDNFWINVPCVPAVYFFKGFSESQIVSFVTAIYMVTGIVCCLACLRKKHVQAVKAVIFCMLSVMFFFNVSQHAYDRYIQPSQKIHSSINKICKILNTDRHYKIYNLAQYFRYRVEIRMQAVEAEMEYAVPKRLKENSFLVIDSTAGTDSKDDRDKLFSRLSCENLYYITSQGDLHLLGTGDALAEDMRAQGFACPEIEKPEPESFDPADCKLTFADGKAGTEISPREAVDISVCIRDKAGSRVVVNDTGYKLAYHIFDEAGNAVLWDGARYQIPAFASEETVTVTLDGRWFTGQGSYTVEFDIVEEGVAWAEKGARYEIRAVEQ